MGMNDTPSGERVHIGFFGRRNAGKSSVVNAVTGQNLAIVSDTKGTTTDPVYKAMELLPLGPVLIIDTPGFDDTGALGELRVVRTRQVLNKTDIAVLVIDAAEGMQQSDKETLDLIREKQLPYIIVYNKSDLTTVPNQIPDDVLYVSARNNTGIHELKERMARLKPQDTGVPIVRDMVHRGDFFCTRRTCRFGGSERAADPAPAADYTGYTRCRRDGHRRQGNGAERYPVSSGPEATDGHYRQSGF